MEDNNNNKKSNRRDFLYISTAAVGAVTVGAAVWPLVNQMNPSADVAALSSIEVDINDLEPGSQLTVKWLGKPVFIRRRTEEEISAAREVKLEDLPDKSAQNANFKDGVDGYKVEVSEFGNCFGTEDYKEGTTAFLEKRKANFPGQ